MSLLALVYLTACGSKSSGGGGTTANYQFSGALLSKAVTARVRAADGTIRRVTKNVDYIMAVNPQTANPDRVLATVDAAGKFSLKVNSNRPYYLVLIDSSQVGKNMIVAIINTNGLQAFATTKDSGATDLGTITANGTTQAATVSSNYNDILTSLGLSTAGADFLKSIQGIGLRYANPDIDGNGKLDLNENKKYTLDFHVRSNMLKGGGSTHLTLADMTDKYFDASGSNVATVLFNLTSAYSGAPKAVDSTNYVSGASLSNGATLTVTNSDGSPVSAPSSYSSLTYGDINGFGADYNLTTGGLELPGSNPGATATFDYFFAVSGLRLTFTNVQTRKKADLNSAGTIVPFLKLNTSAGKIASVNYQYMKMATSTTWVAATDEEVKLVVNDDGGYAGFYYQAKANSIGCKIPRQATGNFTFPTCNLQNVTATQAANVTPADICSMAFSYDDKLGLRNFVGAPDQNGGVTACP